MNGVWVVHSVCSQAALSSINAGNGPKTSAYRNLFLTQSTHVFFDILYENVSYVSVQAVTSTATERIHFCTS